MTRVPSLLATFALAAAPAAAQDAPSLDWYLPDGVEYDPEVPTPASVLGWEVGTWHVRHDQLVRYFDALAAASPRMALETYAHSHEDRPLLLATFTAPANHERLEELRAAHVEGVRSGAEPGDGPAVVWMGYGVHGNESSASNASLLLAYHLAAATGDAFDEFLASTVVLVDPCINPDGSARFAQWANSHRGTNLVGDPAHREHNEVWPGGRTNHYWFDLNRDWLLLTHPESKGRIERFHRWLPCVLTDYHEMGSDSTYFFQPGIPSRRNPITPERNVDLTEGIASFHADALDAIGSLYYTEESFDDFYYGKGSTYPDVNGGVGILFEQASSRGHLRENSFGEISFPFTIRNQVTTSLSTLRAVDSMRDELRAYQREFYRTAREEAARHPVLAYVFGAPEDPARTGRLADLLRRHAIRVHRLGRTVEGPDGVTFSADDAFAVPTDQPQFRLIRALFETRTSWPDNTFYDVSSWALPLSFGVPSRALGVDAFTPDVLGAEWTDAPGTSGSVEDAEHPVAWLFEWHHARAARALQRMLEGGVRARVATKPFRALTAGGERDFDRGTIVVPTGVQDVEPDALRALVDAAAADGLHVRAATSGLTPAGVDLGSGSLRPVEEPVPLLVVGSGVSSYESGATWHELDRRIGVAVSMVERDELGRTDLERYTHLLLVSGASSGWSDATEERVREWVRGGGVLVATRRAAVDVAEDWLPRAPEPEGEDEEDGAEADDDAEEPVGYDDYEQLRAEQRVAGTIFEARLDLAHPLCFGYVRDTLPVFRNSETVLPEGRDPFATPLRYTDEPLLSGFASEENVARIAGTPVARVERFGRGTVVCLIDDPNFRGVWDGTAKLFANAVYFGGAVKRTGPIGPRSEDEEAAYEHGHSHGKHD